MPVYEYAGINAKGKSIKGVFEADNPRSLKEHLKKEGVYITDAYKERAESKQAARNVDFAKYLEHVTGQDMAIMTQQLSVLLGAGIPLVEALTALVEQTQKPKFKKVLGQIKEAVNEGAGLGDAMKHHPKIFDRLYINMVTAGESSGTLEVVMDRLADFTESQEKLKSKIIGAMIYPVVMMGIGGLVLLILLYFVVPNITAIYEDNDAVLPLPTQVLIGLTDFLNTFWYLIIAAVAGGIVAINKWFKSEEGRAKFDENWLKVPIFGRLTRMVAISRFSKTLSTLLRGGVPLIQALDIVRGVLNNTVLSAVIDDAKISISEGDTISGPLKRSGEFPPMVTHMIAVGERTGQLESMLENVARTYDTQVDTQVNSMTTLLEPIMIVGMGVTIAGIVFAIMLPILQMNEMIQ